MTDAHRQWITGWRFYEVCRSISRRPKRELKHPGPTTTGNPGNLS